MFLASQWGTWLEAYGTHLTDDLMARIMWYGQLHLLEAVRSGYNQQRYTEMNQALIRLQALVDEKD
jgi:hypothetical protein